MMMMCYQTLVIDTLIQEEVDPQNNSKKLEDLIQDSNYESSGFVEFTNVSAISKSSQDRGTEF